MMNAFCASENFDAFIAFRSSQPGKTETKFLAQIEGDFRERISGRLYLRCEAAPIPHVSEREYEFVSVNGLSDQT